MTNQAERGTLDDLRSEIQDSCSYLDVLAWGIAESGVTTFTGDSSRWSQVVHELRKEHPELLAGIWFSERGFSEQLEDFFRVMARSGALSFANPRYERIDLTTGAAEAIRNGIPESLQAKRDEIQEIATRLASLKLG